MLDGYPSDLVANPTVYCASIGAILSEYSQSVVDVATDPRTGIQNETDRPPTVKQLRVFCQTEAARQWRVKENSQKSKPNPNRPYTPPDDFPGCRARVKVLPRAPQFPEIQTIVVHGGIDNRDWRYDADGSIWISQTLWETRSSRVGKLKAQSAGPADYHKQAEEIPPP